MHIKRALKEMKILHGALFVGVILFAGVSIVIHLELELGAELVILPEQSLYIIILVVAAAIYMGHFLFTKNIALIEGDLSLEEKVNRYRSASILRAALIETAALSTIIGYILSGDLLYLILLAVPLMYFVYTFPKENAVVHNLQLTYAEQQKLGLFSN